jgi:hypothetical protein
MGWYDKNDYYVYLAGVPGREMKIGYTWSPKYRLRRLSSGRPGLKLIAYMVRPSRWEAHETEQELHRRFERFTPRGEWHPWNREIVHHFAERGTVCV